MKKIYRNILIFFLVFFLLGNSSPVFATAFTLVPPTGNLSRGQEVPFTINIDTQGASVTSIQTGIDYDTAYLEYVSAVPGSAMNTVTTDTSLGAGKLLLTGSNTTGFTGTGVFATVTFRIIAASSGSTTLCTLWAPSITPTVPPVYACNSSCTTSSQCPSGMTCYITSGQTTGVCRNVSCTDRTDCTCLSPTTAPTAPPVVTALPQTGNEDSKNKGAVIGGIFIFIAGSILYLSKRSHLSHPNKKNSSS